MNTTSSRFTLDTDDGHVIEAFAWQRADRPRAVVQIVHGMAEHSGRYRHVAEALASAGYAVIAHDHRGHGALAREQGRLGDFGPLGFKGLVKDMVQVGQHARSLHPGLKLVMVAHSMGSFAAQLYMLDHAALVDGIVMSGTSALELLDPRTSGWTVEGANVSVDNPRTPCDWLSRDPAVPAAYMADPLCAFPLTEASLASIFDEGLRTTDPGQFATVPKDLPLYLFTGDKDCVNRNLEWFDPLVTRLRERGFRDLSTHVYGGARHETLNETNRAEVIAHLIAWIDRVTG